MKTKSSRSSHPLVAFIILTLIAGLISADIFFYFKAHKKNITTTLPTVTTSKNWKTYTDSGLGFQIDYPADRLVESYFREGVYYTAIGTMPYEPAPGLFTIEVQKDTTVEQYLAKALKDTSGCTKPKDVVLNSYDALFYSCESAFAGDTVDNFIIAKDNNVYNLNFMLVPQGTTAESVQFVIDATDQKMLDSFHLTDSMVDWQTFAATDYGFTLRYPNDWQTNDFSRRMSDGCCGPTSHGIAIDSIETRSGGHEGIGDPLKIYLQNTTPNQYIAEYNKLYTMGLKNTDWLEKNQKETINGVEVTHMTIGTAIGSNFELLFFDKGFSRPFFIQYDNWDPLHQQILSTFHVIDDMSDWKTYNNQDTGYEYSLKYPPTWRLSDFDSEFVGIIPVGEDRPRETHSSTMLIEYFHLPLGSNKGSRVSRDEVIYTLRDKKEITINGYKAVQGIKDSNPNLLVTQITTPTKIYQISWPAVNSYPETFQQILSTFKFIK